MNKIESILATEELNLKNSKIRANFRVTFKRPKTNGENVYSSLSEGALHTI
jgi:hypothetical protein